MVERVSEIHVNASEKAPLPEAIYLREPIITFFNTFCHCCRCFGLFIVAFLKLLAKIELL